MGVLASGPRGTVGTTTAHGADAHATADRAVLGELDPDAPSPLGRGSLVRRVAAEPATALLVQRALVMEVSHPAVAAGVSDHSSFRAHPLSRAWATADAAVRLVFGDTRTARSALRQIYRTHDHINGAIAPAGPAYTAHDATLLRWVWATLVDTAEVGFTRWVRPLRPDEAVAFYTEMLAMARFLGIPGDLLPADRPSFADYLRGVLDGPELGSTPATAEMARAVLWYRHPLVPPAVVRVERALALATLDRRLLGRLGIEPSGADERLGRRLDELLRAHYRRLPALRRAPAPLYVHLRKPTVGLGGRLRGARQLVASRTSARR